MHLPVCWQKQAHTEKGILKTRLRNKTPGLARFWAYPTVGFTDSFKAYGVAVFPN